MSVTTRSTQTHSVVRVLACVAAPFDPEEVHELAAADVVVVDSEGIRLESLHAKTFALSDWNCECGATTCTPMDVAAAVWGRRAPDALAAHDASTASLVFTRALTGRLPWVSLHKVARRVWPGQHSYDLNPLARWRAWAGPRGPFSSQLPSGAERDAELAAGLLAELLYDPGLRDVAEGAWLDQVEREGSEGDAAACFRARDALEAALVASALPSKPLREAPYPFDDQREWAGLGLEDLRHFARFSKNVSTAEAARTELQSRPQSC